LIQKISRSEFRANGAEVISPGQRPGYGRNE